MIFADEVTAMRTDAFGSVWPRTVKFDPTVEPFEGSKLLMKFSDVPEPPLPDTNDQLRSNCDPSAPRPVTSTVCGRDARLYAGVNMKSVRDTYALLETSRPSNTMRTLFGSTGAVNSAEIAGRVLATVVFAAGRTCVKPTLAGGGLLLDAPMVIATERALSS